MLAAAGYSVRAVSSSPNRYLRLADIASHLLAHGRRADVQCLQVFSGPSFVVADVASMLGRLVGQRIVMVLRGGALPTFIDRHRKWARRVLGRADALVAPSNYLAQAVGESGFHAHVIPNILDLSLYQYRHRTFLKPNLFWMRAFEPLYNPEMAVRVLAKVRETVPEATLTMAGQDKGGLAAAQSLAEGLSVAGSARFPGFLDTSAKRTEGEKHDVFLNTNHIDNMPVGVVEAAAMGIPIVSTAVGGMPYLLTHEETGLLVPDDGDEAMADAVLRLLGDADLAGRLSKNGRRLAEESSSERVLPMWDALLEKVMSGDRGRADGRS